MVKVKNDGHIMWLQLGHTNNSEPGYVSRPNKGRGERREDSGANFNTNQLQGLNVFITTLFSSQSSYTVILLASPLARQLINVSHWQSKVLFKTSPIRF